MRPLKFYKARFEDMNGNRRLQRAFLSISEYIKSVLKRNGDSHSLFSIKQRLIGFLFNNKYIPEEAIQCKVAVRLNVGFEKKVFEEIELLAQR